MCAAKVSSFAIVCFFINHITLAQQPQPTQQPQPFWTWDKLAIDVAAGGGFAGVQRVTAQTTPHFECNGGGPTPVCKPVEGMVVVSSSSSKVWQPALSTGLVFRYVFRPKPEVTDKENTERVDGMGLGVAGQFVFVPEGDSSQAAPAVTINFGRSDRQVFFGWIFQRTDSVKLPLNGPAIVPADFDVSSLIIPNAGHAPVYFAGIVIGGISVTQPKSPSQQRK